MPTPKAENEPAPSTAAPQRQPETTNIEVPVTMNLDTAPKAAPQREQELVAAEGEAWDPRADAMKSILANRAAIIERENQQASELYGASAEDQEAEDQDQQAATQPAPAQQNQPIHTPPTGQDAPPPAAQADGGAALAAQPPQKIILNVDGRQLEVNQDELTRLAQMGLSATQRFEQAARLREEAFAIANGHVPASVHTHTQPAVAGQRAPQAPASPPDEVISLDVARDFAKRMTYGTEEDQVQAARDLGATIASSIRSQAANVNAGDVVNQATQQAIAHIRFENDLQTIGQEFPDLFYNYPLSVATGHIVGQLRFKYEKLGIAKSNLDLYREGCVEMRKLMGKTETPQQQNQPQPAAHPAQSSNPPQSAQPANMQGRIERKRAAPQPPAAVSRAASDAPQSRGQTPSQIVSNMRKQRGQPVY